MPNIFIQLFFSPPLLTFLVTAEPLAWFFLGGYQSPYCVVLGDPVLLIVNSLLWGLLIGVIAYVRNGGRLNLALLLPPFVASMVGHIVGTLLYENIVIAWFTTIVEAQLGGATLAMAIYVLRKKAKNNERIRPIYYAMILGGLYGLATAAYSQPGGWYPNLYNLTITERMPDIALINYASELFAPGLMTAYFLSHHPTLTHYAIENITIWGLVGIVSVAVWRGMISLQRRGGAHSSNHPPAHSRQPFPNESII
jgi:hypothetical protein